MRNAGIYTYALAPFSLGKSDQLSMSALIKAASNVMAGARISTGETLYQGLELSRTGVLKALIHGPTALLYAFDPFLGSLLGGLANPQTLAAVRFMISVAVADVLEQYNQVDRPASSNDYLGGQHFQVGTRAGWVAEGGDLPAVRQAREAMWWGRDATSFADTRSRLAQDLADEQLALIWGIFERIEEAVDSLQSTRLPGLEVLTPAPTRRALNEMPGLPPPVMPQVVAMSSDAWTTYPRMEFEVTAGTFELLLGPDPLRYEVNQQTDQVELAVHCRSITATGLKVKLHWYISVSNFIWRIAVPVSLAGEQLTVRDVRVRAHLAHKVRVEESGIVRVARSRGLEVVVGETDVDFEVDFDLSAPARALRDIAQAVDALVLPGDVVPSLARLEAMIGQALGRLVRKAARDHLSGAIEKLFDALGPGGDGAFKIDLPGPIEMLHTLRWPSETRGVFAAPAPTHETFIGPGFLGHRWVSDFDIHTPLKAMPFMTEPALPGDGSVVVGVVLDYLADFIGRATLARLQGGGQRITDVHVKLEPPAGGAPSEANGLALEVRLVAPQGETFVRGTVYPTIADAALLALSRSLTPTVAGADQEALARGIMAEFMEWVAEHPDFGTPADRVQLRTLPYIDCLLLALGAELEVSHMGPNVRAEAQRVKEAVERVFPLPFALGPQSDGAAALWTDVEVNQRYLAFRWQRNSPMNLLG